MSYERYKSDKVLSKSEKVQLMEKYVEYYKGVINTYGIEELNVKIPRETFADIIDEIGDLLVRKAKEYATVEGPVLDFLNKTALPPELKEMLPDDFRAFSLLLNALKQWVSAESNSTDRYLLGGTARETCRSVVNECIVTGEPLDNNAELHHPVRDGRPPILLSKYEHTLIEGQNSNGPTQNDAVCDWWTKIVNMRAKKSQSWVQLREGCNAILTGSTVCRSGAKSFANCAIRESGKSAQEIIQVLDIKNL